MRPLRVVLFALLLLGLGVTHVYAEENMLANPDFEEGVDVEGVPEGWLSFARHLEGNYELSDRYVSSGKFSLRVWDESRDKGVGVRSAIFDVLPGETYLAEVDVYVVSGGVTLYLDFTDGDGRRVQAFTTAASATDGWQRLSVQGTVPEGALYVSIILYSSTTNIGEAYFDNALLRRVEA